MINVYSKFKSGILKFGLKYNPDLLNLILKYKRPIKYVISGGTAAFTDLAILFILEHFFDKHYLVASMVAFSVAFFVSFLLQKFWTFKDNSMDTVHHQMFKYLFVGLVNLGINTLFMYIFVDIMGVWYILAQILSGFIIACGSFFIYKIFIFKNTNF